MDRLDNQVVMITGAASGIGLAVLDRFVDEGARVVAVDLPGDRTDELRERQPTRIAVVPGDVRTMATNRAAVDTALERFGGLDVYIGNAGIFDAHMALAEIPDDELASATDEILAVNVKAYLLGAKASLSALLRRGGSMIFTASPSGLHPAGGGALYTASKHAVVGIVRRLAFELAPRVRVNGVAPGGTATDLRGPSSLGLSEQSISGARARRTAAQVNGETLCAGAEPSDHVASYLHLASRSDSAPITGHVIESFGAEGVAALYRRGP